MRDREDRERTLPSAARALRSALRYAYRATLARYQSSYRLRLRVKPVKSFMSVVMRVKNEGRFLPELIAHHYLIGFEHFYLYDNNSTDGIEEILRPFVERGIVTIVSWPTIPAAPSCYAHFFQNYAGESRWVAFLDADEFLIERERGELRRFLEAHSKWPALAINWRYFGSSNHEAIPSGLVISNFVNANKYLSSHVKVIVRPETVLAYYNPHNFIFKGLSIARDIDGVPALGAVLLLPRQAERRIQINHYIYRSKEDYLNKTKLGFADAEGYRNLARRAERTDAEFARHNSRPDSFAAVAYAASVNKFLTELGYGPPYVDPGCEVSAEAG